MIKLDGFSELTTYECQDVNGGIGTVGAILIVAGVTFILGSVRGCSKADGN